MGLQLLTPSPRSPWGLGPVSAGTSEALSSALTVFDYGIDDSFYAQARASDTATATHEAVRRSPEALSQMRHFYETGEIVHPCDGPCILNVP